MKNKIIKSLMKVVMVTGIVVMFNIVNIVTSFATEVNSNLYIVNNQFIGDDKNIITKYANGSWSSYSLFNGKCTLTENSSTKQFDDYKDLDSYMNEKIPVVLKNNPITKGISSHSDKIYVDDLSTDENLNKYATQWLKDNYNMDLDIPIIFDNLDDKTNGYYSYKKGKIKLIQINKNLKGIDIAIEKTLIHELVHTVLFENGKDFKDETESFRQECTKKGSNTNYGEIGYLNSHLKCTL